MKPVTVQQESRAIVYDADALPAVEASLFEPEYWREQGALSGSAPGRGTSWFIDAPWGASVLRRYKRGGMVARFNDDRYLYSGRENSRPFREFHVLEQMAADGLRVPAPLAALCERRGPTYRAALLTRRIAPAAPLADEVLEEVGRGQERIDWERLGAELRTFFNAGMDHADLNARNILLHQDSRAVWVIDLDASTYNPAQPVDGTAQLARLKRSLDKLWPPGAGGLEDRWAALLQGHLA